MAQLQSAGNLIAFPRADLRHLFGAAVKRHRLPGGFAILTQGPSANDPESNHRMEIIDL